MFLNMHINIKIILKTVRFLLIQSVYQCSTEKSAIFRSSTHEIIEWPQVARRKMNIQLCDKHLIYSVEYLDIDPEYPFFTVWTLTD